MQTKRRMALALLLTMGVLLLSACGTGRQPAAGSGDAAADAKEPILIGLAVEETGGVAWAGQQALRGAQLRADLINQAGGIKGRPIKLVVVDTETQPAKAVTAAKKLVEQDKVVALIGFYFGAEGVAVEPLVAERGPVTYVLSGAYIPKGKYMFAGTFSVPQMQDGALQWLKATGRTRAALLTTNDQTGQIAQQAIQQLAKKYGVEIVETQVFNPGDTSVTTQLARIKSKEPQALIAWTIGPTTTVALNSFHQMGMDELPFITNEGNISPQFVQQTANLPIHIYIPGRKDLLNPSYLNKADPVYPVIQEYYDLYKKRWQEEPGEGSGSAWDAVSLIADAIDKAGTDPAAMAAYLEKVTGFKGVEGVLNFSPDNHRGLGIENMVMLDVFGGKLQPTAVQFNAGAPKGPAAGK